MEYTNKKLQQVLKRGSIKGLEYCIVSYGTHPCGYINIDAKTISDEEVEKIKVHGGITYYQYGLEFKKQTIFNKSELVIGWDYAHSNDQYGYDIAFGRKYDIEDIMCDVRDVIKQLKRVI